MARNVFTSGTSSYVNAIKLNLI